MKNQDRSLYRGCLLGGAVGDALGAPVEFYSRQSILAEYGPGGIRDLAPAFGRIGAITDDTQMTLFTAEGMLRAHVRGCMRGITTYPGVTAYAYLRWLRTQGVEPRARCESDGWLIQHPELFARRAPGNTCIQALAALQELGDGADNHSKGCGAVMRVAPVGLYYANWAGVDGKRTANAFNTAAEIAGITHGHPTGQLAAGFLAVVVAELARGEDLQVAIAGAKKELREHRNHEETTAAVEHAERLAVTNPGDPQSLPELGQGWIAEEALGIALYSVLSTTTLEEAVTLAVNHDGDSDSTGAITGNLAGALYGEEAIPERWLEALELREAISAMAEDLHEFPNWGVSEYGDQEVNDYYWARYPGE
ncbi:hypothetical protein AN478_06960 [Thiohalorhabdus denitrificans]|uniref:ADP-ribosylglycohydrolase n=1 Tax=Thiohalorhabdus denitrificans TaxID=381306 RepID=A0A0P9GIS7_9GAMM|nr:ADP-ribosylglycohydrolase family protein [Thiohalorhabdus denitrificans]KPV39930.1 hypothetical protein AN478_06960 [Thiohalorhabdus denitrificans]SCY08893.1 ADP-ribosylglycohydrolase [Thiohalorhabdus denitrificans]